MLNDYLVRARQGEKINTLLVGNKSPNVTFAARVEKIVCEVCQIAVIDLWKRRRTHQLATARYLVFSILWQPHGFRSLNWLGKRYGLQSHRSVYQGIVKIETTPELKAKQTTIIELLVTQLEIELFGSRTPT